MNPTQPITPQEVFELAITHRLRWMVPAAIVAVMAIGYAVVRPDTWQAAQALSVRDEAIGVDERQRAGDFERLEQMAAVQETVMELARSRGVLEAALIEIGPASGTAAPDWPTADDIKKLRKNVSLSPPDGAEFGSTEIFYLKVKDHDRQRAMALATTICDQLTLRFQGMRNDKTEGMIHELTSEVALAREELDEATAKLSAIETRIGSDLAELRILDKSPSGDSDLRKKLTAIETELRAAEEGLRRDEALRRLLVAAGKDHDSLIATPNSLLDSQPALRQLKNGLIEAKLHTAQLLGRMSEIHPSVLAAREAEREVQQHLHAELDVAIRGIEVDLKLKNALVDSLTNQRIDLHDRLGQIASERAEYANLIEQIAQKTKVLTDAEKQLAEVRSSHAASLSTSLLYRIDSPDTGADPIGPGRKVIVAAGLFGGLLIGAGVLFLTITPGTTLGTPPAQATAGSNGHNVEFARPRAASAALSLRNALAKVTAGNGANR